MKGNLSFNLSSSRSSEKLKVARRQKLLTSVTQKKFPHLYSSKLNLSEVGSKNCENLVGSVEVPVGVAGPVRVKGAVLDEEIILPLATTEGALAASVNRGCRVISSSGGAQTVVRKIGMTRAPVFQCKDGVQALNFVKWLEKNRNKIDSLSSETSNHLKLTSWQSWVRGRYVYVRFVFDTDQAMGMNMVTIALKHTFEKLLKKKRDVKLISISSNMCTDKKSAVINNLLGRGYWVQSEVFIDKKLIVNTLDTRPDVIFQTHLSKNLIGSNLAGSFSQNMHAANVVAALYLATGQDVSHVVEGSQTTTSVEVVDEGLYVAVTLPSVLVGVVGGGTWLEAQSEARNTIRKGKKISAEQLAAAIGVGVLAGEISGLAALSNHTLSSAHAKLGRGKK